MNRPLFLLLLVGSLAPAQLIGEELRPGVWRLNNFQDDDISLVLRTLARQGNLKLIISGELTGTVTLRVENKTPREVIDMIVAAKGLTFDDRNGTLYIHPKRSASPPASPPK